MGFDWHIPIIALAFMVMDVVTGVVQAIKNKSLDSTAMRNGLFRKVGFIFVIVLAYMCEYAMGHLDLGFNVPMVAGICTFICLTEVVSILENITKLTPELSDNRVLSYFNRKEG